MVGGFLVVPALVIVLRTLMTAEISNAGLAHAVISVGAREGKHLHTTATSVRRMLDGAQLRWPVPRLVAAVLSQRLQHEVKITECGFVDREPTGKDPYDGLTCSGTLEGTVRTIVELSGRVMHRRKLLLGSVFSVAAFAEPTMVALIVPPAQGSARAAGQRVGMAGSVSRPTRWTASVLRCTWFLRPLATSAYPRAR